GNELGNGVKQVMRVVSMVLLILVGAVFVLTPSGLLAGMMPEGSWWSSPAVWTAVIFVYYMLATILPVDKVIGNFYPVFGFALLFMAAGILAVMVFGDVTIPDGLSYGLYNRRADADSMPVFPMMFVSIACGAISGFHATQSPMMARCLKNERLARPVFYGAMVAEGIVALIWAAAAITFTGGYDDLGRYMSAGNGAGSLVHDISIGWLGTVGGLLAIFGVVAAPITTGDTALRSARLIAADFMHVDQKPVMKRLLVSLPLFAVTFAVMMIDFNVLWRYFAWSNQTLAVFTLWAATVYLARHRKAYVITLLPALFMTVVSVSYVLFAPSPEGFGLGYGLAVGIGIAVAALFGGLFARYLSRCAGTR
ncbi:MAG: carbon starvation protein A, partial [Muribaculaceae bacterium]|nr:carbon starvation protein A [Muribaculaceae bacterium]